MRLRRLILARYGHLSEVELAFPESPGLHVVLGANEAGKSTALTAIGDCLYRIPHRTPFNFLHDSRDLRIGVTLQARDGRQETFIRRKRLRDDLADEQDQPRPEAAIERFLAGVPRARFEHLYGLNGAELRRGGLAILGGEGEVGEALLGAQTGLHGFREVAAELNADAGKLYGDKRGQRAFHKASDRYQSARQAVAEKRVEPAAWKQVQEELAVLEQARLASIGRTGTLQAERTRLDRIRRTTPARLALQRSLAEAEALGSVPDLPADAATRHADALTLRAQAQRDLAREGDRLTTLERERQGLTEDSPILAHAEAIDALAADRQRIVGAIADRDIQRLIAEQREAAMLREAVQLELRLSPEQLEARIPSLLQRDGVNKALQRHAALTAQFQSAAERDASVAARLETAAANLAAEPAAHPFADLRAAIDAAKAEGRLDAELAEAEAAVVAAAADLARGLASLPLWQGEAAALAAMKLPADADLQRLTLSLNACRQDVDSIDTRLAEHDRVLAEDRAQAQADAVMGTPPTIEAIAAARQQRDAAWGAIRRRFLEGGSSPSAVETVALGDDPATLFEALIEDADRLVDQRAAERERAVALEQRRAEAVRRQCLKDSDQAVRLAALDRLSREQKEWRALWRPAGVEPGDPMAMREWLQLRGGIVQRHDALLAAEGRRDLAGRRHQAAWAELAALLPAEAEAAAQTLSRLVRSAERVCAAREAQHDRVARLRSAVETASSEREEAQRDLSRMQGEVASWRKEWVALAGALSLPADMPPDVAGSALVIWDTIEVAARERRLALERIADMTASINAFAREVTRVVRQGAPDLTAPAVPPLAPATIATLPTDAADGTAADAGTGTVSVLAQRLALARQAAERRRDLMAREQAARDAVEAAAAQLRVAADMLQGLQDRCGATDDDGMAAVIQRWVRQQALQGQIAEREAELHRLDDGRTLTELTVEAEGHEIDLLPARIEALEAELRDLAAEDLARHETMVRLRASKAAMEQGQDAATSAQAMETAVADMEDVAARYVQVRLATVLLRAGMERFRRQRQGPLLRRAGHYFNRLTEGRYDRLEVDEKENGDNQVIARQASGAACPADRLSEGTLDQLYLALRLAAIEAEAQAAEPLPFIGDDLLVNFDDGRAAAALRVLAEFAEVTQVILFTHHEHIAGMAKPYASVHPLGVEPAGRRPVAVAASVN